MMDMMRPASSALSARGPIVSSVNDNGMAFARLTRPYVGLRPVTPQKCAGRRIEPPVSEPSAAGVIRAATPVPDPEDEPPVTCAGFQALRALPKCSLWPVG